MRWLGLKSFSSKSTSVGSSNGFSCSTSVKRRSLGFSSYISPGSFLVFDLSNYRFLGLESCCECFLDTFFLVIERSDSDFSIQGFFNDFCHICSEASKLGIVSERESLMSL